MAHRHTPRRRSDASVVSGASEADANPWLGVAGRSALVTLAVGIVVAVVALISSGLPGLYSSLAALVVVLAFFGISLVVAAYVGHKAPKAIMAAFMLTYVIKVIGFGALLLIPHDPAWFSKLWMTVGAVAAVIVWQLVEVYLFSKLRLQIFADSPAEGANHA